MTPSLPNLRLLAVLASIATFLSLPVAGQNVLLVNYGGKVLPVRAVRGDIPYVEQNGRLVAATGNRFGLKEVPEYFPAIVDVQDLRVGTSALTIGGDSKRLNNQLKFNATFDSPVTLENVFLVLELETEAGQNLFLWEVGLLSPHSPSQVSVSVRTTSELGMGSFKFHVFSGGIEVFNSNMGYLFIDSKLDAMVAKRIEGVQDSPPRPFVYPAPEYPRQLRKAKFEGRAIVTVRIPINGSALDPVVKSATDPAFGTAAVEAVKQWRFLPRVKDGSPLETVVDVPFDFHPPNSSRS